MPATTTKDIPNLKQRNYKWKKCALNPPTSLPKTSKKLPPCSRPPLLKVPMGGGKSLRCAINFDILRTLLGDDIAGDEAYEFTWVGKREAIREAGRPIRKTLRPCVEESKNWDATENLYIEGDNLDVLKLLQESYLGKVKMIYIDPP
ncbi:MAG: hypothetical protein LBU81_04815, partial [Methanosarcinales archaeon]|nr:hypothetical protein [Methanosarcinales archaeon]